MIVASLANHWRSDCLDKKEKANCSSTEVAHSCAWVYIEEVASSSGEEGLKTTPVSGL